LEKGNVDTLPGAAGTGFWSLEVRHSLRLSNLQPALTKRILSQRTPFLLRYKFTKKWDSPPITPEFLAGIKEKVGESEFRLWRLSHCGCSLWGFPESGGAEGY